MAYVSIPDISMSHSSRHVPITAGTVAAMQLNIGRYRTLVGMRGNHTLEKVAPSSIRNIIFPGRGAHNAKAYSLSPYAKIKTHPTANSRMGYELKRFSTTFRRPIKRSAYVIRQYISIGTERRRCRKRGKSFLRTRIPIRFLFWCSDSASLCYFC